MYLYTDKDGHPINSDKFCESTQTPAAYDLIEPKYIANVKY